MRVGENLKRIVRGLGGRSHDVGNALRAAEVSGPAPGLAPGQDKRAVGSTCS